jgi:L-ascorbate metabolism protein UlaG (beta-lactamase superfamily)
LAAPKYKDDNSNHFDGNKFVNPDRVGNHSYFDVLKWWLSGNDKGVWQRLEKSDVQQFPAPEKSVDPEELHVTFINHASFLLRIDGVNILTDPIWSYRASPYQWIGPKRMRPPGIEFDDLPPIDLVLISHNHYDHLDIHTVKKLAEKHDSQFIVPLGVEQYLNNHGVENTIHVDWWEELSFDTNLSLTTVPARHFSGRGLFDRNQTLWCGYVLHTSVGNVYFAGDTGYGNFLKDIGNKFGPLHTAFIPIGAYRPRWFMKSIHLSPEDAVIAHRDLQSKQSIAMHFGTFPMADDGMTEAVEELEQAQAKHGISAEEFSVLPEGKTKVIKTSKMSFNKSVMRKSERVMTDE